MNLAGNPLVPLPSVLNAPLRNGLGRRNRIGDHQIDPDALRHFNELLEFLHVPQAPLDSDQVVSAARELVDGIPYGDLPRPRCIQQRMRRAAAINLMLDDPDWATSDPVAVRAMWVVVDYLRGNVNLIPNTVPVVGRLDDAIVVEAAWPVLATEVRQYLEFCRIRHVEANLRGESRRHFGFTCEQWEEAVQAEVAWIAHCVRVGQDSYVSDASSPRFRIS